MKNREYRETEPRMNECSPLKRKRRRYQFSLRTLLALTTLFAVFCSWYAYEMRKAAKRRAAIAEIIELGGEVSYYDADGLGGCGEPPRWYSWLRHVHGDEYLGNVVSIRFPMGGVTDAGLVHLRGLTLLERLNVEGSQLTDAGLVHLEGLTNLERLGLNHTHITDAGLVHLRGMTNLSWLHVDGTVVTDAGLEHLRRLAKLELLDVNAPPVPEVVKKAEEALPDCEIVFFYYVLDRELGADRADEDHP